MAGGTSQVMSLSFEMRMILFDSDNMPWDSVNISRVQVSEYVMGRDAPMRVENVRVNEGDIAMTW